MPDDPTTGRGPDRELVICCYQIEFHATIAEQEGRFTIADVVAACTTSWCAGIHTCSADWCRRRDQVVQKLGCDQASREASTSVFRKAWPCQRTSTSTTRTAFNARRPGGLDWPTSTGRSRKGRRGAARYSKPLEQGEDRATADEIGDLLVRRVNVVGPGCRPETAIRVASQKFRGVAGSKQSRC